MVQNMNCERLVHWFAESEPELVKNGSSPNALKIAARLSISEANRPAQ